VILQTSHCQMFQALDRTLEISTEAQESNCAHFAWDDEEYKVEGEVGGFGVLSVVLRSDEGRGGNIFYPFRSFGCYAVA